MIRRPIARRNYRLVHMNKWQRRRYLDKILKSIYQPYLRRQLFK